MEVSLFVVAGGYSHVGFYKKIKLPGNLSRAPPRGNRNRPIGPSKVPGRAHCPSGGRHDSIFNIRCVRQDMPVYMKKRANLTDFHA